jgi:hypothetical protein
MNYELALNVGFCLSLGGSVAWLVVNQVRQKRARSRAMAAVYERRDVTCTPRAVGMDVRISIIPMPPPEARGFFNPALGEPFEWVADKEDVDGAA